jgi:hypothetical protein
MKTFSKQRIGIDGKQFQECVFEGCSLVYSGGLPPTFDKCEFNQTRWEFEGEARNTLLFMTTLYRDPGLRSVIEQTLDNIRSDRVGGAPIQ